MQSQSLPLVVVLGPTGAGKSDLAIRIGREFEGEIVNFDSIQVYRRLDIGSAKLRPDARGGVPHHLLDILEVTEELTAGAFARRAQTTLSEISGRHRLPVLVGGTGFYLRALLDGLSPAPLRDPELRAQLAKRSPAVLHRFLRRRDPVSALRIHPNDGQKLIRAVEMTVVAGKPASETQASARHALEGYSVVKIGLAPDRTALRERLDRRSSAMFENGLIEETAALLADGVPPETKALQSLGYRQAVALATGKMNLQTAVKECQAKTRQYAKRQMTWFRAEAGVWWLHGFGSEAAVQDRAIAHLRGALLSQA